MRLFYISRHAKHRRLKQVLVMLLPLVLIGLLVWFLLSPRLLTVEKTTIQCSALDPNVGRLKIVYLADIHYGNWPYLSQGDLNSLATRINEQKPDLVLLGGDYGTDPDHAADFFRQLPAIRATYGVYAVLGECDHDDEYRLNQLKTLMRQNNITPLINESPKVRIGTKDITIVGLDDVSKGKLRLAEVAQNCMPEDLVILLCHDPTIVSQALRTTNQKGDRNWFDLGLFGHTHGGQITLFGGVKSSSRYDKGWYNPNRLYVLVTNGIGTSGIPLRLGSPPQLHVITLVNR